MYVHGPFARAKINKVISTFLFYEDVRVYRLHLPLDSVQYRLFFTHLTSEIKKNPKTPILWLHVHIKLHPKYFYLLCYQLTEKHEKNHPMLKMFWILPLAENTTKIFLSEDKYFTKLVLQLSHFPENESWFPRVFCSKRLTCYPSYFMQ